MTGILWYLELFWNNGLLSREMGNNTKGETSNFKQCIHNDDIWVIIIFLNHSVLLSLSTISCSALGLYRVEMIRLSLVDTEISWQWIHYEFHYPLIILAKHISIYISRKVSIRYLLDLIWDNVIIRFHLQKK